MKPILEAGRLASGSREGDGVSVDRLAPFHALSIEETAGSLKADPVHGLPAAEIPVRQAAHGPNELTEAPQTPHWRKFLSQFQEVVILLLIGAAVIAGLMGEGADALAILAIVVLNGVLGFIQEERAEQALAALRRLSAPMAKVVRDGLRQVLPARELVPGDRIELEAGDSVPADARLIRGFGFRVQESALTGESVPVDKHAEATVPEATPLGDRRNMLYMGTVVAAGKGTGLVVSTGMHTELGRIAGLLQTQRSEPTPLQRRLAELGKVLVVVCLAAVVVIFTLQVLRGGAWLDSFMVSVSLAVAAVPEGLPAVVTLALALGLQRMVGRNALIRKLPSVETLGSVTVICTDKTGTLTRNEMTVRELTAGGRNYRVTGVGYTPHGEFHRIDPELPLSSVEEVAGANATRAVDPALEPDLLLALRIGAWCNNARVTPRGEGESSWQVIGDPTEGALIVAGLKAGIDVSEVEQREIYEVPFDSDRKAMSVVIRDEPDQAEEEHSPSGPPESRLPSTATMYTKGALEAILPRCSRERVEGRIVPLTEARRAEILSDNMALAGRALRVLALAYRPGLQLLPAAEPGRSHDGSERMLPLFEEHGLIFAGLAGMIDPPREEVKAAVATCYQAGIRPVMITGDHPATALAIARELGISGENSRPAHAAQEDRVLAEEAVSGSQLDALSDDALIEQVERIAVFARVSAEHKLRVVRAWKARGQIVAMTGDGVNDAPAMKAADIGIAMGVTGTDVTKEASDMVLTDDNFTSIVSAVEEGRGIFDNIQKFIHFLLSCNTGEILFMLWAVLAGWPAPLTAIQLLWINLVTDGLPALALGMEPPESDVMKRRPRPPRQPVITRAAGARMLASGLLIAGTTALGFLIAVRQGDLAQARTVALCVMAYSQLFLALSCRSQTHTLLELGPLTNPALLGAVAVSGLLQLSVVLLPFTQPVFDVAIAPTWEWIMILLLSLLPVTLAELGKVIARALCRRYAWVIP